MAVASTKVGQVVVISPAGRLDAETAPELQDQVVAQVDAGETAVLLDLSALDYVSSAGLRAILVAAKKLQEAKGKLALCGLSEQIAKVFEVSGFDTILDVHPDQSAALAAMG